MKSSNRPVRINRFEVRVIPSDEVIIDDELCGEFMFKSDVHYCAEKVAIDEVVNRIELNAGIEAEYTYLIYKVNKDTEKAQLISKVYCDVETQQVVID